jgi:hypothetical protein
VTVAGAPHRNGCWLVQYNDHPAFLGRLLTSDPLLKQGMTRIYQRMDLKTSVIDLFGKDNRKRYPCAASL